MEIHIVYKCLIPGSKNIILIVHTEIAILIQIHCIILARFAFILTKNWQYYKRQEEVISKCIKKEGLIMKVFTSI